MDTEDKLCKCSQLYSSLTLVLKKVETFIFLWYRTTPQSISRTEGATAFPRKHHEDVLSRIIWIVLHQGKINPCPPLQNQSQHPHIKEEK